PTWPPRITIAYTCSGVHQHAADHRGALDGGTEGMQTEFAVGSLADWVVDATDDLRDLVDVLGDLGRHDVAIIALGQDHEAVRLFHSGSAQQLGVGSVTDHEGPPEVASECASCGTLVERAWPPVHDR